MGKILKWIYKLLGKQKCKNCIRPINKQPPNNTKSYCKSRISKINNNDTWDSFQ